MAFTQRAAAIWRDYVTPLNPLSGLLQPNKSDIRQWGKEIEDAITSLLAAAGFDTSTLEDDIRAGSTLASPKNVLQNDPFTQFANGAVSDGNGGILVPAGSTGAQSQIRARFNLSASDIAANAGRTVRFVSVFKVSIGFLTAFKDNLGNVTLSKVADGVTGGSVSATLLQPDTVMLVMDAILTGNELLPASILFIGSTTQPLAADATARLIFTAWYPADASGATDVLAKIVQPLPSSIGELIAVATVRRALTGGAVEAFADRGLLIPAGQTGAGSLLIAGTPAQGLAAGVVVRARFLFGASTDIEPSTVLATAGATVSMATGPDVGAASFGFAKLATGVYEGTFTYTMTGPETRFEFFLTVGAGSGVRSARGFVRLEQATLEIVSTPLTTTINGQVASYRAQNVARLAQVPGRRREVIVAADGSSLDGLTKIIDGTALMSAAGAIGPDEANIVRIMPGTYFGECAPGAAVEASPAISPAAFVHLIGQGRGSDIQIISRFADNQANQETIQPLRIMQSGYYANFTVIGRNLRYPLHIEAGNAPNRAVQVFDNVTAIHEGATGFVSSSGFGIGNHPGNRQLFRDCRGRSPTGAFGAHDNINWAEPCSIDIEGGAYHGTGIDGRSITLTSTGSGVLSPATVRGATLAGHVRMDCSYLSGALLANHKANRFGYSLTVYASSPIDVVGVCDVSALTLTSVAGASSAVAVSGPGAAVLFGATPDVRDGAADYAARVYSYHAVDVPVGEVDPGVTLAARLGNRTGSPLSLGVAWDGQQPVTVILSADYSGMSNAAIVSALNSALATAMGGNAGGRAFSLTQPYNNCPPIHQPDREGRGLNVGNSTILHGMALARSGRDVRVMTSADDISMFAGIAIGDTIPGRQARWLEPGAWLGQAQIRFDGTPSIQIGDRFQVSASVPGAFVEGADRPVLFVRSVEPHGACLEIIDDLPGSPADLDARLATRASSASLSMSRADIPSIAVGRSSFVLANGAPYVLGTSSDFMAIQDGSGTWYKLDVSGGRLLLPWIGMVPGDASSAVAAANAAAINGAMAALSKTCQGGEIVGSGYYYVSAPIDNRYPRVLVRGPAPDVFHDVGTPVYGLTFAAVGAITVLRHRTPSPAEAGVSAANNQKISGGGFRWLAVIGGARCLQVTSTIFGEYHVSAMNATGTEAVLFDCLPDYRRPDVSQMGEASDTQYARINLVLQQDGGASTKNADCLVFSGYPGCGNPSYIFGACVAARHADGVGLRIKNGDNIIFDSYRSSQVGGAGGSFRIEAPVTSGGFAGVCDGVEFCHYGSNSAGYVEGTADRAGAATPAQLTIWKADASNGTPPPTGGADAYLKIHEINGLMYGLSMAEAVSGETLGSAFQGRQRRRPTTSHHIYNGSDDHLCLDNGNTKLNVNINSVNGDARINVTNGSGKISTPKLKPDFVSAANDAAAAAAGVEINELYYNTTGTFIRPRTS